MSVRTTCSCDVRGCKRRGTIRVTVNDSPTPALCPIVMDVCDDCAKKHTLAALIKLLDD